MKGGGSVNKKDKQRESECIEFGCQFISKCVALRGKTCIRQGGDKIPTHRVSPQGVSQRLSPRPQMRQKGYFLEDGHEITEGREWWND